MPTLPAIFFPLAATINSTVEGSDSTLAEVESSTAVATSVPCSVQQYGPPRRIEGDNQRRSVADVVIFFRPTDEPGAAALSALLADDKVTVSGYPNPLILDGPPYQETPGNVVWLAGAKDYR